MEIIDLEMIPGGPKKTCHTSQFDNGRVIRFNLKENGQPFALSGTETVQAIIRKPDGSETTLDIANTSSTYVDLITEEDTCDLAGVNHCEMKVTEDGEDLGSGNFDMKVEEDAYGAGDVSVGTASGPIASFETDIKDELIECVCEINPVQDLHGYDHPWPAGGGRNLLGINSRVSQTTANVVYTSDEEYIYLNGTKNGGGYADMTNLTLSLEAGTYYLKAFIISGTASNTVSLYGFDGSDNITPDLLGGERALTLPEPKTFRFRFAVWADGTILNNYKIGVVVSRTSNIDKFYPFSNICPIEGHTEMDIIRSGVNLWDEEWEAGGINSTTGNNTTESGCIRSKNFIPVYPGQVCYFKAPEWTARSIRGRCYRRDKTYIDTLTFFENTAFTIPADCYYFRFVTPSGAGVTTYGNNISINYPSTDTAYHPAEIIEKNIQLGQTVYRARINITTGQGIIDMARIDMGSLEYTKQTSGNKWAFIANSPSNSFATRAIEEGNYPFMCELYPQTAYNPINEGNNCFTMNNQYAGTAKVIRIKDAGYTDAGDFKTAVTGHYIIYELAEPVSIQLTPEQIETLLGQKNNVYHTANGDTAVKFYTRA